MGNNIRLLRHTYILDNISYNEQNCPMNTKVRLVGLTNCLLFEVLNYVIMDVILTY